MRQPGDFAVVYDITNDRERGRVDKILLGYGFRVQKSVFECKLGKGACQRLLNELNALNLQTGYVYLYRLQHGAKRLAAGKPPPHPDAELAYIV